MHFGTRTSAHMYVCLCVLLLACVCACIHTHMCVCVCVPGVLVVSRRAACHIYIQPHNRTRRANHISMQAHKHLQTHTLETRAVNSLRCWQVPQVRTLERRLQHKDRRTHTHARTQAHTHAHT